MRFKGADGQLTVEELLRKLEKFKDTAHVHYSWDLAYPDPKKFCSYRGTVTDFGLGVGADYEGAPTVKAFKEALKASIGKEYEAWKGGCCFVTYDTLVYAANNGCPGLPIVDCNADTDKESYEPDDYYQVLLKTAPNENW